VRFPHRGLVSTRCPSTPQSALASARDSSARVCAAAALGRAAPPCPLVGDVRGAAPTARLVASPLPVIFLGGDRISPFGGGRLRSCSPSPFPLLRPFFCSDSRSQADAGSTIPCPRSLQVLVFTDVWIVGLICIANGRIIYA